MFDLIVIDKEVCSGAPRIKGTRLTVYNVVSGLYYEGLDYLSDRDVSIDEARQAVKYAMTLQCQKDMPFNFCDGCILRTIDEGWKFDKSALEQFTLGDGSLGVRTSNGSIFLGSLEEYEEQLFGKMGWVMAEIVYKKYEELWWGNVSD